MDFSDAVARVSEYLRAHGKAKDSTLLDLLGGDAALLALVREELIFEGLAEDVRGVGLQWMGDAPEAPSASPPDAAPSEPTASKSPPEPLPPPGAPVPVFLSYGHADAADFTKKLAERLRKDGFPVWIDETGIQHGPNVDWEAKIEAGIHGATVLVAVLSPHAVRRPDGVCLDEIAMARYTGTAILPVMRVACQPPLGIYRLNWLDARLVEGEGAFEDFYQRLRVALANQDFAVTEGTYAELLGQLRPLDFGRLIANYTRRFTGRAWLHDAVSGWLDAPDASPVFLLKGDPGTGKSAALAWLSGQLPGIGAIHFCRADNAETLDPAAFVRSIAAQLAHQLGTADAVLDAYRALQSDDPGALFEALVATPTFRAASDPARGPLVVVVDGLDEAARRSGPTIPALLADYLPHAAPGLRFLLSTRDEPRVLARFSAFKPFVLEADRPENRDDLRAYLALCFREPKLCQKATAAGATPEEVAGWIEHRAEGNFLYASQAVAFVEQMQDAADAARLTLQSFPSGLSGLYDTFFARLFPNRDTYDARVRPLLDLLVAARAPLTPAQVAAAAGTTAFDVQAVLRDLAAFFPNDDGRYRPYHTSIPDWLRDADTLWRVDVGTGHARLAEAGLRTWWPDGPDAPPNPDADPYHIQHLPAHLQAAVYPEDKPNAKQRWDDAVRLLTDFPYLHARADARDAAGLGRDLADTARALPDRHAGRETLRVLARAVQYDTGFLQRHPESLFQQLWNRGWWWDSSDAANHCSIIDDAPPGYRPPWERGGAVHCVLERWRTEGHPGVPWLRALRPPADLFAAAQRVFQGHTNEVQSVSWSPTGRLASASRDNTVRVWDVDTGESIVLEGHTDWVNSVSWSADGRLASASDDKTVRVWDVDTGESIVLEGHTDWVNSVSWSADGRLASASDDKTVRVWDVDTGESIVLEGHTYSVQSVSWSADGRLASASSDGTVRVWDVDTGESIVLEGHTNWVNSVSWSADGRLASASRDNTVRVWDVDTGESIVLEGHTDWVNSVSWSPTGRLASASRDNTVRVWDVDTGESIVLEGHTYSVQSVSWSPTGRLASASRDNTVRVWDVDTGESIVLEGWTLDETFWARYDATIALSATAPGLSWERIEHDLRVWQKQTSAWLTPAPGGLTASPVAPVLAYILSNEVVLYRWEEGRGGSGIA